MSTEINELIFSAQVRALAYEFRQNSRSDYYLDILGQISYEKRAERIASWDIAHPLDEFIPQAIQEIERIATVIKSVRNS